MTRIGFGAVAWLFASATLVHAEDKGFHSLFNGKDLSGWVLPDDKSLFTVENGEIVGRTKGDLKKNEFLVTDKPYGDFVLKAKVKLRNGNSGIQFRSTRASDGVVAGPQADAAEGFWGLLYEERRRGILKHPDKASVAVKANDWNDYVITAKGDHVTMELNGTKVIDLVDPKFDRSGIIALQVHQGPPMEVRYKDIEIKTLD
jgi:hypothetical protein